MLAEHPHEILGIPADSSITDIRRAYRRLAKANHPDVDPSPGAVERMARINHAYEVLSRPRPVAPPTPAPAPTRPVVWLHIQYGASVTSSTQSSSWSGFVFFGGNG
jgi:DnaJ-domain-containing protein 1